MAYGAKYGNFYGVVREDGAIAVLHVEDGLAATRLDASVWPLRSIDKYDDTTGGFIGPALEPTGLSARYEHAEGIILDRADAEKIGLEIEAP